MIKTTYKIEDFQLHQRLGYQLARLSKTIENSLEARLVSDGLSRLQWCVLSGVGIENHTTPSDLALHIGVSRPSLSRVLKTMNENQLIERTMIGGDGRTRTISLTEKGLEKLAICWSHSQEVDKKFASKLSSEQFDMLGAAVDALMQGETVELEFNNKLTSNTE